jgi:hypothetical protein
MSERNINPLERNKVEGQRRGRWCRCPYVRGKPHPKGGLFFKVNRRLKIIGEQNVIPVRDGFLRGLLSSKSDGENVVHGTAAMREQGYRVNWEKEPLLR